uniref:Enoyl-CoA hydratase domain-containing protein 3, mitochondrial n=1 Tax=Syphacia muris TaxID=451379 RepID=A0A0N5API3_9BILA
MLSKIIIRLVSRGRISCAALTVRKASQKAASTELFKKEQYNDGKIVRLVLSDSARRNALSFEMVQSLQEELEAINTVRKHHVLILAAEGPAFSSGHDLKQLAFGEKRLVDTFDRCAKLMLTILNMDIPVIAEVSGIAAAAGCQLVATCDVAVAGKSAKFSVPGVKVGLFCSTPGIALTRTIPRKVAFDMLCTAEYIDAQKALSVGLISRVVDDDDVKKETMKVAEKIASFSRPIMAMGKKFFYSQHELSTTDAYRMATRVMVGTLKLKDSQQGIKAFIEKRKPEWTNSTELMH